MQNEIGHDEVRFVIAPGLHNSGPLHWQSLWEARLCGVRVEQDNWRVGALAQWTTRLIQTVLTEDTRPTVIIAHSLGCLATLAAWPALRGRVSALFLAAPAAPGRFGLDIGTLAAQPPEVPCVLVGSQNDPWMPLADAEHLAGRINATFVDAGSVGHINSISDLGLWPAGWTLLERLLAVALPGLALPHPLPPPARVRRADQVAWLV